MLTPFVTKVGFKTQTPRKLYFLTLTVLLSKLDSGQRFRHPILDLTHAVKISPDSKNGDSERTSNFQHTKCEISWFKGHRVRSDNGHFKFILSKGSHLAFTIRVGPFGTLELLVVAERIRLFLWHIMQNRFPFFCDNEACLSQARNIIGRSLHRSFCIRYFSDF